MFSFNQSKIIKLHFLYVPPPPIIFYGELTAKSVVVDNVGPNNSSMKLIRIKEVGVGYFWQGRAVFVYLCIFVCVFDQSINRLFNYATP